MPAPTEPVARDYDVVVVGSANLDLVARTGRLPGPGETVLAHDYAEHPGGKGLNQAVAAARSGASVAFVGAVGEDAAGRGLLGVLATDQIDARAVAVVSAPTGRALIAVDDAGENSIVVVPGANHCAPADAKLPPTRVVLAQLEVPIPTVVAAFQAARGAGCTTILNTAPAAVLPGELLACCDVLVANEHELLVLGGVEALGIRFGGALVVTRASEGADVHVAGQRTHVAAFVVDVVDTTGAGDAFCGALAARLAAGASLNDAVRWANAAGALATTVHGAVPAQPRADQIRRLLAVP